LFSGKMSWAMLRTICLSRDSLLFANILALMSLSYKVIVCLLRRIRRRDRIWHKTVAGFLCGIWIVLDRKRRRNTIALYCIVRALSDCVRLSVIYKKVPAVRHFDVATFSLSQIIIMFGAIKDPKGLDPKYYRWILRMGALKEESLQNVLRSPSGAMYRAPGEHFVECCPSWHPDPSCLRFAVKDWFSAFVRAAKMYVPVHFVPTVLLAPKSIIKTPVEFLRKKSWNTMVSASFLATYVFNMRYTICLGRNLVRDDPPWLGMLGGATAGMALFIENPRRRSELMLYCLPRALEWIIHRVDAVRMPRLYKMLRTDWWPTIVTQIALAIWLSIWNIKKGIQSSNTVNMTVLNIVFGSRH